MFQPLGSLSPRSTPLVYSFSRIFKSVCVRASKIAPEVGLNPLICSRVTARYLSFPVISFQFMDLGRVAGAKPKPCRKCSRRAAFLGVNERDLETVVNG